MMIRPVLLAALVVCSLGITAGAVQPAAGDGLSDAPQLNGDETEQNSTNDGTSDDGDGTERTADSDEENDDGWYDGWESDRENRSENGTTDDEGGGANETTDDGGNASTAGDDGNGTDGADGYGGGDDGDDDANESDRDVDRENWSHVVPGGVLSDETVEWVAERAAVEPVGLYRGPGSDGLPEDVPDLNGDDRPDARDDSSASVSPAVDDRGHRTHDRTAAPAAVDAAEESASTAQTSSDSSGSAGPDGRDDDGAGETPDPPGGAGAGVALFVTVGYLGGTRSAVTQANFLATTVPGDTLASLRAVAGEYLPRRPDVVAPVLFGYSRHDSSDPLQNDTRAAIYEQVHATPGIYHARLAEETDVAVETVRYHCRVLAEEGLVEPRKHRGKRRLYPVSLNEGDPELAAAIADSAAADVLSAVERLEPATLSAVAEAVDCAPSTVAYHLDRLEEDGLLSRERDGGAVQVRLRRSTRSALDGTVADD
jgi:DNA-binding transcriptional ArsR family regulator